MTTERVNGRTLKQWMAEIDAIISKRFGISSSDLADTTYWDMWNDEMTPTEAADEALANDDLPWLENEGDFV
tara:strand:+ start:630 stop:845 length:216 start_codon:yes stop_codon:yes gene_type:complete